MTAPVLRPYQTRAGAFAKRFWARVDCSGGPESCWPWIGCRDRDGYGKGIYLRGKRPAAHRVSYFLFYGLWPEPCGLHTCDHPWCCNPRHVFSGTNEANTADRHAKRRDARGDANGTHRHPERLARGRRNGKHTHPEKIRRGEAHPHAKLTIEQVRSLRAAKTTGESIASVIRRLGVGRAGAYDAARGRSWGHI